MWKKDNLFWKLKELIGCSYEKIGNEFGISKQAVQQSFSNHSVTYQNSNKFMTLKMIDIKIKEYQAERESDVDRALDEIEESAENRTDIKLLFDDKGVNVADFCEDGSPEVEFECGEIEPDSEGDD
jgi:hypothetical protein|nr:MAG TPA: putative DNA binding protein [Caudoviricetes sp.]